MVKKSFILVLFLLTVTYSSFSQKPWELHGELQVTSDGRMLQHADGTSFFWLGDTAWDMTHSLNHSDLEIYLSDRSTKKYTVLQTVAVPLWNLRSKNLYEEEAFHNGNLESPNETYWKNVDYVISACENHGLYVAILPVWGNHHVNRDQLLDIRIAKIYSEFIANRYKNSRNIIWILGGDLLGSQEYEIWNKMGNTINSIDSNHLITFHPKGTYNSNAASIWFNNQSWLDINMIQTGHSSKDPSHIIAGAVEREYSRLSPKPIIDGESRYENIKRNLHDPNAQLIEAFEVREAAYWEVFAGAFGYVYGHSSIWEFSEGEATYGGDMHWKDALNDEAGTQMQYLYELMNSRPILGRVPDQLLISGSEGRLAEHIRATRGDGYALIYTPSGSTITVNMEIISGNNVDAWWYNPKTGEATRIGTFPNKGTKSFQPNGGHQRGNDWVLVLDDESKGYGAPGRTSSLSVTTIGKERNVNIYPIPSKGIFNFIYSSQYIGDAVLKVFDIQGKQLKTLKLQKNKKILEYEIDLSSFDSGVYFIQYIARDYQNYQRVLKK